MNPGSTHAFNPGALTLFPPAADPLLSQGAARVMIRSIGSSGFSVIPIIAAALDLHPRDVADRILRAPGKLLDAVPLPRAGRIAQELRSLGLDAVAEPASVPLPGPGEAHEVALAIRDIARIRDVLRSVMELLAIDIDAARELVCREPCVLLGSVSEATASVLAERFSALGCEVDVSRPAHARFDLLLPALSAPQRSRLLPALRALGIACDGAPSAPLIAGDLDYATANQAWEILRAQRVPGELRNRDFARADVILERATADARLCAVLAAAPASVPQALVERVVGSTPVVVCRQARLADAGELLASLSACGAQARAELRAGMRCRVVVARMGEPSPAYEVLRWLGRVPAPELAEIVAGRTGGPLRAYGPTHAQWLVQELKAVGTVARIELE